MGGINSIGGNFGFNFDKKVTGSIGLNKANNLLFDGKVEKSDTFKITTTPGNTGVAEATARGTLKQLDEITKVGL